MKHTKITNTDLTELKKYFDSKLAYLNDELAHMSLEILKPDFEKYSGFLKNIENIQKTLNELEEDSEV